MKTIFFLLLSLMFTTNLLKGQQIGRGHLYQDSVLPVNATTNDSVELHLAIGFPNLGDAKLGSNLEITSDSIRYSACYLCYGSSTQPSTLWDTVKLGKLVAGVYHLIIIASYPASFQDSCFVYQPGYNDTLNRSFTVSEVNSIQAPNAIKFSAKMKDYNLLNINTDLDGTLSIAVYNALGQNIYKNQKVNISQGNNTVPVELPAMAPGLYFYAVIMNGERMVLKYVKQ